VAGALLLLAGGVAAAVLELTGGSRVHALSRVEANSVGVIEPKTNRIVAQIPVGAAPTRLALAGDDAWILNYGDNSVSRIDTKRRIVLRTVALPGPPSGVAADEHGAWAVYLRSSRGVSGGSAGAAFVDARFNDVARTVVLNRLFQGSNAVALGAGSVWTADPGFVTRLEPATGKIQALIPVGLTGEQGVAVAQGAVWALGGLGIVRIDLHSNKVVATIPLAQSLGAHGLSPTSLAVGGGAVWVTSRFVSLSEVSLTRRVPPSKTGTVSRIDPANNAVIATIPVGHDPFSIAVGDGAVWVANRTDFSVSRIDLRTNRVVATIRIGNRPREVAAGEGAVWVTVGE
jgi:YVTN family beta-propeller protein